LRQLIVDGTILNMACLQMRMYFLTIGYMTHL